MRSATHLKSVVVLRGADRVGTLKRTEDGSLFEYHDSWTSQEGGIAFSLPFHGRSFSTHGVNLHPFFANLLPEGLRLRALVRSVKTSPDDLLSLLMAAGDETVGDVRLASVSPRVERPIIDKNSLATMDFEELRNQLLSGAVREEALSGVQPKISAPQALVTIRGARGKGGYLLKFSDPSLPHLVQNEHACMTLAKRCGIRVARTQIIQDFRGNNALLVERFDRLADGSMVHFEDICQLTNRYPADKYNISVEEAIQMLLKTCSSSQSAVLEFLRVYTFSYLIGNGDMHAKNFGVLGRPASPLILPSPIYDLLTTLPYKELDQKRAMSLDSKRGKLRRADVLEAGRIAGVAESATRKMVEILSYRLSGELDHLETVGLPTGVLGRVRREILRRMSDLEA